ncbi:MAG: thrombospondin type 3 repeat-containing protein [Candidatus Zixiibacteriota bacterium]|nr:MAG: thrombospondin type 3 repeat-containing protein [candidate division Zixibacteria bacterium]
MRSQLMYMAVAFLIVLCATAIGTPPPANYQISTPDGDLQNEEQFWVSPVDSNIIIGLWRDFRLGYRQVTVGRSTDGGQTWIDSLVSQTRFLFQSDPCVDVDREGNFFLSFMDWDNTLNTLSILKSRDGGLTWEGPTYTNPSITVFDDKQFITVDRTGGPYDGNLYMSWARYPNSLYGDTMMFVRLQKDGFHFDTPYPICAPWTQCGNWPMAGQFAQPLVGSDGAVYVFFNSNDTTNCTGFGTIHMVKSTDGGATMSDPEKIINVFGHWQYVDGSIDVYCAPAGAVDIYGGDYDGNIYISYANMDTTNKDYYDYNIEFIRSSDDGATWSKPIYINDDGTGPGTMYDQFHPWLACNQDGYLAIIFYDQRLDTVNHYEFDVFAAYSFDGGESFTTNHRISTVSSNPLQLKGEQALPGPGPRGGEPKAGKIAEYICVTIFKDHVNAIWTDTRNGNQDAFGANWILPILEPRLLSPVNGENVEEAVPHFDWATAWKPFDDQYRVEVATDGRFINMVFTAESDSAGLVSDGNPLAEGLYYWRVKAFRLSTGDSTDYSRVGSFTVGGYVCVDSDGDGFGDPEIPGSDCPLDNCPYEFNMDQVDGDADGIGDDCDNCPDKVNEDQLNSDSDSHGDECDNCPFADNEDLSDIDEDGIGDVCDNCPEIYNPGQEDENENDIGDACEFICGDANSDEMINILDVTFIINYLYKDGPAPDPIESIDTNGDDMTNILDVTHLINYLYKYGPDPIC